MKTVNIARFKAQLSRYLRVVRKGEEIVVTDRNLPVAKVCPIREVAPFKLEVHRAVRDPSELRQLTYPRADGEPVDSLGFLLEERRSYR